MTSDSIFKWLEQIQKSDLSAKLRTLMTRENTEPGWEYELVSAFFDVEINDDESLLTYWSSCSYYENISMWIDYVKDDIGRIERLTSLRTLPKKVANQLEAVLISCQEDQTALLSMAQRGIKKAETKLKMKLPRRFRIYSPEQLAEITQLVTDFKCGRKIQSSQYSQIIKEHILTFIFAQTALEVCTQDNQLIDLLRTASDTISFENYLFENYFFTYVYYATCKLMASYEMRGVMKVSYDTLLILPIDRSFAKKAISLIPKYYNYIDKGTQAKAHAKSVEKYRAFIIDLMSHYLEY